jgi:hypothetical protein
MLTQEELHSIRETGLNLLSSGDIEASANILKLLKSEYRLSQALQKAEEENKELREQIQRMEGETWERSTRD